MSKHLKQKESQLMEIADTIKRLKSMQSMYAKKLEELYSKVDEIQISMLEED